MAAAAAELVPELLRLKSKAVKAMSLERNARVLELYERALAAAEASLPPASLVLAFFLVETADARVRAADGVTRAMLTRPEDYNRLHTDAWRKEEQALAMMDRCMALLLGRWRAGSLFTHAPEEAAFFSTESLVSAELLISCANNALCYGPPLRGPAAVDALMQGLHGSLLALLELNARGVMANYPPSTSGQKMHILLKNVFNNPACAAILARLRLVLSRQEELELRQLAQRFATWATETAGVIPAIAVTLQQRATADVARHGLRRTGAARCRAAPRKSRTPGSSSCAAAAAAPPTAARSTARRTAWKRHKRQDDCKAAASQMQ
jgi:hypothetical protein